MKRIFATHVLPAALVLPIAGAPRSVESQVLPSFTYQGRLTDGGVLANGIYDMEFKIFDAVSAGTQIGITLTANNAGIIDGVVTIELNFGTGVFTGQPRW